MPERAHVTSVEALDSFRASLIVFVNKARPALEEVTAEVVRTKLWLENEQRLHWENQVRRRRNALDQAKQALSSARLSILEPSATLEQMAVQKARRALEEAEAKLKLLKRWTRDFDSRVQPLLKEMDKLHSVLSTDMARAAAFLAQAIATLAAYADIGPALASSSPAPAISPDGIPSNRAEAPGSYSAKRAAENDGDNS
jgi:DNA repair ATPase RecN